MQPNLRLLTQRYEILKQFSCKNLFLDIVIFHMFSKIMGR